MGRAGPWLPCLLLLGASLQRHARGTPGEAAPAAGLRRPARAGGAQIPLQRGRRATGLLSVAAYVTLTPLVPGTMDAVQLQPLLGALPAPRPIAASGSNITALGITTQCGPVQGPGRACRCLPGYEWDSVLCLLYAPCGDLLAPCRCLRWTADSPGACQPLLPGTAGSPSPAPSPLLIPAGGDLAVVAGLPAGATAVTWYLLSARGSSAWPLRNGTQALLAASGSEATLRVASISLDWAGEYVCQYVHNGSQLQLRQRVAVALGPADVVQLPAQVSMDCRSSGGITLRCCIRNRGNAYSASWSPGPPAPVDLVGDTDPLCHSLALETCPAQDTPYQCVFESQALGTARTVVTVSGIRAGEPFCPSDDSQGGWAATKAGRVAEISCPDDRAGIVQRSCSAEGVWGEAIANCTDRHLLAGLRSAQLILAGLGDPRRELARLFEWLRVQTQPGQGRVGNALDLLVLVTMVDTLSRIAVDSALHLDSSMMTSFLAAASQMLDFDPDALWVAAQARVPTTASTFLQSLESIARRLVPGDGSFAFLQPNVELQGSTFHPDSAADYAKTFHTQPLLQVHISKEVVAELVRLGANVTVTSMVLKKLGRILPPNYGRGLNSPPYVLGSLLLSSNVMSSHGSLSHAEVVMSFGHRNQSEEERPQCVFWDHSLFRGEGGWSAQGCQTSGTGNTTKCTCQHLTSFSVLLSIHSIADSFWLDFLSQSGVCASILALLLCLGIYALVWRSVVRNQISHFRYLSLVNIALCLLMGNLWFFGSTWMAKSHENKLCTAATFFTHFFYLAMFFWMLVQALMLFHRLVFVFHQLATASVLPFMATVGYLCPLVIAAAAVAVYFPKQGYVQAAACWLNVQSGAIYAFAVPVLVIVLVNVLILFVVVLKLMRPSVSEGPQGEERKILLSILKALLVLTPVFGLTWGLGVVTMTSQASELFHYLFAVLNSFQGVFILVFGCLMDKKVRDALLERIHKEQASVAATSQRASDRSDPKPRE